VSWLRPGALHSGLAATWRAARPFPHVIVDDLVDADHLLALRQAIAREPHWPSRSDLYELLGSADEVSHPVLREFHAALGAKDSLAAVRTITGKPVARVDMRSYVYLAGSYLLPHTDAGPDARRLVAYAFYLLEPSTFAGGELELFDCDVTDGDVVATRPAKRIEPRAGRIVLFDVGPETIHQVTEVTTGGRCSLAGWFL
jgi:hypothetical protein